MTLPAKFWKQSKIDPRSALDRKMATAQVALLNIEACDCCLRVGDTALTYRIRRGTALWQCLSEIEERLREEEAPAPEEIDGWDVYESFVRIYRAYFDELRAMQELMPSLGCLEAAESRLQAPTKAENEMLVHVVQREWTRLELVS